MNYYVISSFINCIASLGVAILVFCKNRKSNINKWFIFFAVSVSFWALGYSLWQISQTHGDALFWIRFAMLASIIIPFSFFEFVVYLARFETRSRKIRLLNAIVGALLVIFSFSPFYIQNVQPLSIFKFWPQPGPVFYFFHTYFVVNVVAAHILLIKTIKNENSENKKRIFWVFCATAVGFVGGMTNHFLWYKIMVPPVGNIGISFCVTILAYAIVRHQLMDIDFVIKKTLVFACLSFFVFACFSVPLFIIPNFVRSSQSHNGVSWWMLAVMGMIVAGLVGPLNQVLVNVTDKYLFQKKLGYQYLLKKASQGISRIRSLDQLSRLIVTFLTFRTRIENAAVLTKDNEHSVFYLKAYRGYGKRKLTGMELSATGGLVAMMEQEKKPIRYEDVVEKLQGRLPRRGIDYEVVKREMGEIKAELVVPSFRGSVDALSMGAGSSRKRIELAHLLVLGKKKSDEAYTQEDADIFFTIAQESAIAIENARLYDEVIERQRDAEKAREEALEAKRRTEEMELELIRREKAVFVEKLVKGISHEINNPMQTANSQIECVSQSLKGLREIRENELLGLREERMRFLDEQLDSLEKAVILLDSATSHVAKITETLNIMQHPEDESLQKIDFKTYWVVAVPMIEAQSHGDILHKIPIKVAIQRKLPPIKTNSAQLTQVFLNLYRNSLYALKDRDDREIVLRANVDPDDNRLLKIEFQDNGSGIPASVLPKIFDYLFTTKGKDGHGIGLNMCRMMIDRFGGSLTCKSEEGKGAIFIIRLKFENEKSKEQQ